MRAYSILSLLLLSTISAPVRSESDAVTAAQAYGKTRPAVIAQPDGLIVCEAEEFQVASPGWQAQPWGENYYAATFANSFLSRKAFLGAPDQCERSEASIRIRVPAAGRYLALVRYEAAYRFETQFRLRVEQNGRRVLDRLYGARNNIKIWAFSEKLKKEVAWSWGAVENVVWEGHNAFVDLQPGLATLTLSADKQPDPAAKRNVDLVMLTTDVEQVRMRIEKEKYLPLDGMLTQAGDVFMKVHNQGDVPVQVTAKPCRQHSPYWVHLRNWKPLGPIEVEPGRNTDWIDVGGLLDTLNDGQWAVTVSPENKLRFEFGIMAANGRIGRISEFSGRWGELPLAFHADTRYCRQLRHQEEVLHDLLNWLKRQPVRGRPPTRTLIYGYTFAPRPSPKYDAAVEEFKAMFGLTDTAREGPRAGMPRDYVDVRRVRTEGLAEYCRGLGDRAKRIAVVSLGDEIGLPQPRGETADESFRAWLRSQGVSPQNVDPAAGGDWKRIAYDPTPSLKDKKPGLYYWSKRYLYHYGIQAIKQRTDILRRHLPNACIGANFSPHSPTEHVYLGETFKWITCFRAGGMTLPWSEDYIWQLPIGTPQMNNINLDLFRAGLRGKQDGKILYYVMPHWPGNTPNTWRRMFYGAIGHGMKIVDLFEFRPVQAAYTENHVTNRQMYLTVLRSFRELGLFEDIVQDGHVCPAEVALWFSETGDIWNDNHGSFAAGKRSLYSAIRHQQVPLDFVIEQDAFDGTLSQYKVLYLTDNHVSTAASQRIATWVERGGMLLATAGAGMFDELNRPNQVLRKLLGVDQISLDSPGGRQVTYIKQDLPFTAPIDMVTWRRGEEAAAMPVIGIRSRVRLKGASAEATFKDGSPAITSLAVGKGRVFYCGLLPGLSYYKPAIPLRPVDRGAADDAMSHFLPTDFDPAATDLIGLPTRDLKRPVECSQPLVETTVIQSNHGTLIPLVNWTPSPIEALRVKLAIPLPKKQISLASGRPVKRTKESGNLVLTFDIDVADALMFR